MAELRAILLPAPEPLRMRRGPGSFADAALRPLARGLVFLAALSLPALACTIADRANGGITGSVRVAAPIYGPRNGAAATVSRTGTTRASSRQALLIPAKFAESLSLQ